MKYERMLEIMPQIEVLKRDIAFYKQFIDNPITMIRIITEVNIPNEIDTQQRQFLIDKDSKDFELTGISDLLQSLIDGVINEKEEIIIKLENEEMPVGIPGTAGF